MAELGKASHRAYNTGFYFCAPAPSAGAEGVMQAMEFVGQVICGAQAGMPAEVELKNRFYVGDILEALTPQGSKPFAVQGITLADTGEMVDTAGVAGKVVLLTMPFDVEAGDILRGPNRNHVG
jgi:U32 family peptidase